MKFSIQKSNAEYINFLRAKTFRSGSAKFHSDYHNWNPRVQKTILKKKSPEDDVLSVTKVYRKFWPAQKNSMFAMKAFYVSSGTFRGTNFWLKSKIWTFRTRSAKLLDCKMEQQLWWSWQNCNPCTQRNILS